MQLSTRGRYAVMAMVELAGHDCSVPVALSEIAASQQLSLCYLEQLFAALRRAGLVLSARGPGGGYRLARACGEVSIAEIIGAVDEPIRATRCEPGEVGCLRGADGERVECRTHELWSELGRQIDFFLRGISLEDVVRGRVAGRAMAPETVA